MSHSERSHTDHRHADSGSTEAQGALDAGPADEVEESAEPSARGRGLFAGMHGARYGAVIVLSFVTLVTVFVMNKDRLKATVAEGDDASRHMPPIAAIELASQTSPIPRSPKADEKDQEPVKDKDKPAETPPAPAPTPEVEPAKNKVDEPVRKESGAPAERAEYRVETAPSAAPKPTPTPTETASNPPKDDPVPASAPPAPTAIETPPAEASSNASLAALLPTPAPAPAGTPEPKVNPPVDAAKTEPPAPVETPAASSAPISDAGQAPIVPPPASQPQNLSLPKPTPPETTPALPTGTPSTDLAAPSNPTPANAGASAIPEIVTPAASAGSAPPPESPAPTPPPAQVKVEPTAKQTSGGTTDASGFIELPTAGKGRSLEDDPFSVEPPPAASAPLERVAPDTVQNLAPTSNPTSSAPKPDRRAVRDREPDRVAPVLHVVQSGENFWTISQLYYNSGRYYKALWWANRSEVPKIDKLYVDQTIRIPPPEDLDPSRFEPMRAATATPNPTQVRKVSKPLQQEVDLPASDPFEKRSNEVAEPLDSFAKGDSSSRYRPRNPVYKVRPNETLRSIARDTLGTSRRADEILELNPGIIDDPSNLIVGQVLELPDDAKVGRRKR